MLTVLELDKYPHTSPLSSGSVLMAEFEACIPPVQAGCVGRVNLLDRLVVKNHPVSQPDHWKECHNFYTWVEAAARYHCLS